jgi:hypothetical protein
LTAEEAQELTDGLQREGKAALEAATRTKEELLAGRAAAALPEGEKALAALKRAADLLPKRPETPEERLRKLIAREEKALDAVQGLATLEERAREAASEELSGSQREAGKEANGIAAELDKRPDEPAKEAAVKVREGEAEIYSSAESLPRRLLEEARLATERGVARLKEALALLEGKDQDQKEDEQKQEQEKQDQGKSQDQKGDQQRQDARQLTPREARFLQEQMDRKRREEEAKIFAAPSGMTVEKDW